jgi:benzoyl-CoA reductase/2-hydroxyglutaryl-CoA dehydratase subunit BcrC/BadD/HgdB
LPAAPLAWRIADGSGSISRADAHLQAYNCSLVSGALEDALDGQLNFLGGVVFPHIFDSIQQLSDIWPMNASTGVHLDAVLPVKLNTENARQYMAAGMGNALIELEKSLDRAISDEGLSRNAGETIFKELLAELKMEADALGRIVATHAQVNGAFGAALIATEGRK